MSDVEKRLDALEDDVGVCLGKLKAQGERINGQENRMVYLQDRLDALDALAAKWNSEKRSLTDSERIAAWAGWPSDGEYEGHGEHDPFYHPGCWFGLEDGMWEIACFRGGHMEYVAVPSLHRLIKERTVRGAWIRELMGLHCSNAEFGLAIATATPEQRARALLKVIDDAT